LNNVYFKSEIDQGNILQSQFLDVPKEGLMITEQELSAAIVTVEQSIRDAEEAKQKFKQDGARLKELSLQLLIDRTKLQTLHFAQGIIEMISAHEVSAAVKTLHQELDKLQKPIETELFAPNDATKDQERQKLIFRTRLFAMKFVAGEEKKII
jgi:hypothetical protein